MAANGKEIWSEMIDKAKEHFNIGWSELAKAAEAAKARSEDAWKEAQEKGHDVWVNAKAKGMEMWDDARSRSAETFGDMRDRGEEIIEDAEKLVRKNPMRALGLSLLVGVIVGALLTRERD